MYRAVARRIGTEGAGRAFDTADMAAWQLFILLCAAGWSGDQRQTVETLARGEKIQFARFEYQVTEEG